MALVKLFATLLLPAFNVLVPKVDVSATLVLDVFVIEHVSDVLIVLIVGLLDEHCVPISLLSSDSFDASSDGCVILMSSIYSNNCINYNQHI